MYLQYISRGVEDQKLRLSPLELRHHVVMLSSQHGSSHCSNVLPPTTSNIHRPTASLDDLANAAPSSSPLSSIAVDPVTNTKPYVSLSLSSSVVVAVIATYCLRLLNLALLSWKSTALLVSDQAFS